MRILLDENFPVDFAKLLVGHEVATVYNLGWSGIKNGELLRRAYSVCEVFVTLDRNLEFQKNIKVLPFGIVVVCARSNRVVDSLRTLTVYWRLRAVLHQAKSRKSMPSR